jgi:hypothetical protein
LSWVTRLVSSRSSKSRDICCDCRLSTFAQQLRRRDHRAERVSELVRQHRQKLITPRHRFMNLFLVALLLGHVAENTDDADDLALRIRER